MTQADAGKVYGCGMDSSRKFAQAINQPEAAKMLNVLTGVNKAGYSIKDTVPKSFSLAFSFYYGNQCP